MKSWLRPQLSKNEDHAIWSHHFMAKRWGNNGNSERLYFGGLQSHCRWWLQPWNSKVLTPWKKSFVQPSSVQFSSVQLLSHVQLFETPCTAAHQAPSPSQFFTTGGQSVGVSASASVLPITIQDWFHLGWTGWICLQSKAFSRVFSNTTVQKQQFFHTQLSL